MIALIWTLTLLGLSLWTGLALGLHLLLSHSPAQLAQLKPWLVSLPISAWVEIHLPDLQPLLVWMVDLLVQIISALGPFIPWLLAALWLCWGLVTLLMLGLAGLLHKVIRVQQTVLENMQVTPPR